MKDEAIEYVKSFFMDVDEAFLDALKTSLTDNYPPRLLENLVYD